MSPFGGLQGPEGLGFVDELKRDISSYLLQNPDDCTENDLLEFLTGTLCYSCPDDCSEDRWRDARDLEEASGNDTESQRRHQSNQRHNAQRPFGAPPLPADIRWPERPQDRSQSLTSFRRSLIRGRRTPDGGIGSDSNNSESSCDSEAGPRSDHWRRRYLASRDRNSCGDGIKIRRGASSGNLGQLLREDTLEPNARQTLRGRYRNPSHPDAWNARSCVSPDGRVHPSSSSSGNLSPEGASMLPQVNPEDLLEFTSCFESSNLQYAVYNVEDAAYDLILENDVHTRGHTQWFYFAVRNGRPGQTVTFRIVNMSKAKSLFRLGMKPLVWSEADCSQHPSLRGCGNSSSAYPANTEPASILWRQCTGKVQYYPSRLGTVSQSRYHTLAFEYTFEYPDDCVFFAYCVPFTYSMLRNSLSAIAADPIASAKCRIRSLSSTVGNVNCDLVEISNFTASQRYKKAVVVSARVHPGESNASWLVNGLISFLLSDHIEAQVLRDNFVWQIVPMLNPDGVICGNYRCGLTGVDLNRQWRRPNKDLHSTIYKLKKLIATAKKKAKLCMYLDLHGHSRKCGIFSYACGNFPKDDYRRFTVRMYPKLLSMLTPEFEFPNCRWRVGKGKRGTGRVVIAKDIGLTDTYTIEASFFGAVVKEQPEVTSQSRASPAQQEDRETKASCTDSEGSDQERLGISKGAASPELPDAESEAVPSSRVILFTPSKLQEFGTNLARALVLQQNLGPAVQVAMQRSAKRKQQPLTSCHLDKPITACAIEDSGRNAIAQKTSANAAKEREEPEGHATPSASGTATPSAASDVSETDDDHPADAQVSERSGIESLTAFDEASQVPLPGLAGAGLTPEEAAVVARPYLGIDVAGVLQDFGSNVQSSTEAESLGSDSDPSEDNLSQQELGRLVRMFARKRKQACVTTCSSAPGLRDAGSEGGRTAAANHANHAGAAANQAPPTVHSTPGRTKAESSGSSRVERLRTRKSRANERRASERQGRRERRAREAATNHADRLDAKANSLQRTVAFGQTTYVVPPRGVPNCTGSTQRALSTGSPSPISPAVLRSYSDSQALSIFAEMGAEKASGIASPDRERGRRLQGWSHQQWPPIPTAPSRPSPCQKDAPQINGQCTSGAHSEAFVLLGTPPKDRFAFPQGGLGDTRRLHGPSSIRTVGQARFSEETSSLTRSRLCMRNASSTMLQSQWQRTCTSALLPISQEPTSAPASVSGSVTVVPLQCQLPVGPGMGSARSCDVDESHVAMDDSARDSSELAMAAIEGQCPTLPHKRPNSAARRYASAPSRPPSVPHSDAFAGSARLC